MPVTGQFAHVPSVVPAHPSDTASTPNSVRVGRFEPLWRTAPPGGTTFPRRNQGTRAFRGRNLVPAGTGEGPW
ncbi:hypothetical protein GCM10022282_31660 [Agromyces indicus]